MDVSETIYASESRDQNLYERITINMDMEDTTSVDKTRTDFILDSNNKDARVNVSNTISAMNVQRGKNLLAPCFGS